MTGSPYSYSPRSLARLATCHQDLRRLFDAVILRVDCSILCGHRGKEEQDAAVRSGASQAPWPTSRHNSTPSEAVDVAPYPLIWAASHPSWRHVAAVIREEAARLGIEVEWGGDWTMRDMPHWQLRRP